MTTARPSAAPAPWDAAQARAIAEGLKGLEGPLLPILHAINDRFGCVGDEAVRIVADVLNLSRAEVHGVVSFYHDFRRTPAERHVVKICRAEACQALGADRLFAEVEQRCAGRPVTVEAVYCLGNCALSPAALVDGRLLGRVDAAKVAALVTP
jgi:formate dehydrogenase subunit gamma